MIRRIRKLMATPFARPPGRRSVWARFAPALCVLGVYAFFGLLLVLGCSLLPSSVVVCGFAWMLLMVGPMISGALAWPRERDLGTLDALAMASLDSSALVWGRFWHSFLPWGRFIVWLLPLHLFMGICVVRHNVCPGFLSSWPEEAFGVFGGPVSTLAFPGDHWIGLCISWSPFEIVKSLARWLNDVSLACFSCAFAYYLGARSNSQGLAVLRASLWVPLAALTVLSAHDWYLYLLSNIWDYERMPGQSLLLCLYVVLCVATAAARWALGFVLVSRCARDIHTYTHD